MARNIQALVMGNGAYSGPLKLDGPTNDARSVADRLKNLHINVILGIDLTYDETNSKIDDFLEKVNLPSTDVSLLYYSGHGMQVLDQNYIVPIDFDRCAEKHAVMLVSIQSIVDRMSSASAVRIVILDACRSNGYGREFVVGKKGISLEKAFFIDDKLLPAPGLAEMKASSDTFIAFAAAPGAEALGPIGGSSLSLFTEAFLKQLEVVDLPLSNLTSRVRQEVLSKTGGLQRTWDQSSLANPFYFSPGSLFFFTSYILTILGLITSVLMLCYVLRIPVAASAWILAAAAFFILSLLVLLFTGQKIYSRLRGNLGWESEEYASIKRYLAICLSRGLIGGYLGGLFAAPFLTASYYKQWYPTISYAQLFLTPTGSFAQRLLQIATTAVIAACTFGFLCTFFARVSLGREGLNIIFNASKLRTITGSSAGGVMTGVLIGPFVALYFGHLPGPMVDHYRLMPGAILGAVLIVFSVTNFDFERLNGRRVWASLCASFLAVVAGFGAVAGLWVAGVVFGVVFHVLGRFIKLSALMLMVWPEFVPNGSVEWLIFGAAWGIFVGIVTGFVIGIAITITEKLSERPVLT